MRRKAANAMNHRHERQPVHTPAGAKPAKDTMLSVQDLHNLVASRIEAFRDGDNAAVLGDAAEADAEALRQHAAEDDRGFPLDVMYTLAWWQWCRYQVLPPHRREEALRSAGNYFERLVRSAAAPTPSSSLGRLIADAVEIATELSGSGSGQGGLVALDVAVTLLTAATDVSASDDPARSERLALLGNALLNRFRRGGAQTDLDMAITRGRQAVSASPDTDARRAAHLSDLATALQVRFELRDSLEDLHEAVTRAREAAGAAVTDDADRGGYLSNLAAALMDLFERTREPGDLDEAVRLARQAVLITPIDHPARPSYLSNLGIALQLQFIADDDPARLDEAVAAGRAAVHATPAGHPDLPGFLATVGNALLLRDRRHGEPGDAEEAVRVTQQAIARTPIDHPDHAIYSMDLGTALYARFKNREDRAAFDAALAAWADASSSRTAMVAVRLEAVHRAARATALARGPANAVQLYATGINDILPLLITRGVGRLDQMHLLKTYASSLACDGAACAVAAEEEEVAVEILERGRAVLWSQMLTTRTALTPLRDRAPALVARLVACRTGLDRPGQAAASLRSGFG
jgi:tetratricopeptide (TPR) repeat protein